MEVINTLRQFRIGPFTIFDTATAYLGVLILSPLLNRLFNKIGINIPLSSWLWLTLPIAVAFHLVFQQKTPFMKMLLDFNYYYTPIVLLLLMTFMGLRNIKKHE